MSEFENQLRKAGPSETYRALTQKKVDEIIERTGFVAPTDDQVEAFREQLMNEGIPQVDDFRMVVSPALTAEDQLDLALYNVLRSAAGLERVSAEQAARSVAWKRGRR